MMLRSMGRATRIPVPVHGGAALAGTQQAHMAAMAAMSAVPTTAPSTSRSLSLLSGGGSSGAVLPASSASWRSPLPRHFSTASESGPLAMDSLWVRLEAEEHGRQSLPLLALGEEVAQLHQTLHDHAHDEAKRDNALARADQILLSLHALVSIDPSHRAHRLTLSDYRTCFQLCAAHPSSLGAHATRFAQLLLRQLQLALEERDLSPQQHQVTLHQLDLAQVRDIATWEPASVVEAMHQLLSHGRFIGRDAAAAVAASATPAAASRPAALSIDQLVSNLQALYPDPKFPPGRSFSPTLSQQTQARAALQALFDAVPVLPVHRRFVQNERWPFVTYAQFRLALHVAFDFRVQDLALELYPRLLQQARMWEQLQLPARSKKPQLPAVHHVPGWVVVQLLRTVAAIPESGPAQADGLLRHMLLADSRSRLNLSRVPEVTFLDLVATKVPTGQVERLQRLVELERMYESLLASDKGTAGALVHAAMFRALVGLGEHARADQVLPRVLQSPGNRASVDTATISDAIRSVWVRMGTSEKRDVARSALLVERAEALWVEAKDRGRFHCDQLYDLLRCHAFVGNIPRQVELLHEGLALESVSQSSKLAREGAAAVMVHPRCFALVMSSMTGAPYPLQWADQVQEMYAHMQVRHTNARHRGDQELARVLNPTLAVRQGYLPFFQRLAEGYRTAPATAEVEAMAQAVQVEAVPEPAATTEQLSALLQEAVQETQTEQSLLHHATATVTVAAMDTAEATPLVEPVQVAAAMTAAAAEPVQVPVLELQPEQVAEPVSASASPQSQWQMAADEVVPSRAHVVESPRRTAPQPEPLPLPSDGLFALLSRLQGLVPFAWSRRRRAQRRQQTLSTLLRHDGGFHTAEEAQDAMRIASQSDLFTRIEAALLRRANMHQAGSNQSHSLMY